MREKRERRRSAQGRRLLAAFLLVALASIGALAAAALIGADRGLAAARQAEREHATRRAAAAAATAYVRAGGWTGADLSPVRAIAAAAGANLFVLAADGTVITSPAGGPGTGLGRLRGGRAGGSTMHGLVTSPVTAGGSTAGSVRLAFGSPASVPGRKNLRRKLGADGPEIVQTVLGVGYRLGLRRDS